MRLDGPRTISDVARLADVSRDRASDIVTVLEQLGVVERRPAGRAHLVTLIEDHPITQSLRDIERTHERALAALGQAASAIAPAPLYMAIYGSWARNEATGDSDLDVAVIADPNSDHDALLEALERWTMLAQRITGRCWSPNARPWPAARCGSRCAATASCSSNESRTPMPRDDTVAITKTDAVAHCRQVHEHLRAAEHSLSVGDLNAAAGTAIDACINAADTVAGMNRRHPRRA